MVVLRCRVGYLTRPYWVVVVCRFASMELWSIKTYPLANFPWLSRYQLSPVLQKLDDLGWMRAAALLHDTIRFIEPTTAASASNLVLSWQVPYFRAIR